MKNNYQPHRFPYLWRLADGYPAKGIEHHGCKVFGTFCCGGGSTMGYKLAGYDHIGGVELDPTIAEIYKRNHHPKHFYTMDIRDFNKLENLPDELYNLDLLDGSPPCTTFSMMGLREKMWGKEKKFAEGQKMQRLDDLCFVYCNTIEKLNPKVCWLENVAGMVRGNSKVYTKAIAKRLSDIGYKVQIFVLNGATMGLPQTRERTFFIGLRKDFDLPKLVLDFNEQPILFREIKDNKGDFLPEDSLTFNAWKNRIPSDKNIGDSNLRIRGKNSSFGTAYVKDDKVCPTLTTTCNWYVHYNEPRRMSADEIKKSSSFPLDYDADEKLSFLCGMSVAPIMAAQISYQIYKQWLTKIT